MRQVTASLLTLLLSGSLAAQPCDPAQTDEVCPDTTNWRSYLPPLAVGNHWQYKIDGFCGDTLPCATSQAVVGSEVVDGIEYFLVQRCKMDIDSEVTCAEPVPTSYENLSPDGFRCILALPFNYVGTPDCEGWEFEHFISGRYDDVLDLGAGPPLKGTRKEIDSIGAYLVYYSGVGETYAIGDASKSDESLVYARIDGVEHGRPAFASCDPSDSPVACPDTTDWRSYFPLEVGNQWQYVFDRFLGENTYDGIDVIGAEEVSGVEHFRLRRCQETESGAYCSASFLVRYDEPSRAVLQRYEDSEEVRYGLYSDVCDLGIPFNFSGDVECKVDGGGQRWGVSGDYGVSFDLGPGPSLETTVKSYGGLGTSLSYVAGIGPTDYGFDGNKDTRSLIYARIGEVEYGARNFAFPTDGESVGITPEPFALKTVYPNPARRALTVEYALDRPQAVALEVVDMLGRVVRERAVEFQAAGPHEAQIETDGLAAGIYVLLLRGDGAEAQRRFVVVR